MLNFTLFIAQFGLRKRRCSRAQNTSTPECILHVSGRRQQVLCNNMKSYTAAALELKYPSCSLQLLLKNCVHFLKAFRYHKLLRSAGKMIKYSQASVSKLNLTLQLCRRHQHVVIHNWKSHTAACAYDNTCSNIGWPPLAA